MNCAEFQEILPEVFEGGRTAEQESHLKSCPACSEPGRGARSDCSRGAAVAGAGRTQPAGVELD